jgi:hypothetical protein
VSRVFRKTWPIPRTPLAIGALVAFVTLLLTPATAQADSPINGTVTTKSDQPIAGAHVVGSQSKTCCPFKRENAKTSNDGAFHLEHPGVVLHFSKEGFEPQTLIVTPEVVHLHIALLPSNHDLAAPPCGPRLRGTKQIGSVLRFNIPKRGTTLSGGKTDVDYVVWTVKPRNSNSELQFWFGPYAISTFADDEDFLNSTAFSERDIIYPGVGTLGLDSRGELKNGEKWRQTVVAGEGGARYKAKTAEDALLFDKIIDSICMIPVWETNRAGAQQKP